MLLTRSVFFDLYQKKPAILRTNKLIGLLKENNLPLNEEFVEPWMLGIQFYIENDFPYYENKIYQHFARSDYNEVLFKYHKIEKALPISLSTMGFLFPQINTPQYLTTGCYSFIVPFISAVHVDKGKSHEEKPESG